jgi:hypothetical protein
VAAGALAEAVRCGQRVDERVAFGASAVGAFWVVGLLRVGDLFVEVGKAALVRGTGGVV